MIHARVRWCLPGLVLLSGCGGQSPTGPDLPSGVQVVVYYDENGDGLAAAAESMRLPGVTVRVGDLTGRTEAPTGSVLIQGVPTGRQSVSLVAETLPAFYEAGQGHEIEVPATTEVWLPATLSIAGNRPGTYLGFGNSITDGEGSSDELGYLPRLEDGLRATFGGGQMLKDVQGGSTSRDGARRVGRTLSALRPAFTLIHYGTNDWNVCDDVVSCFTVDSLRSMVERVKTAGSLPVLATILPANTGFDARAPARRNDWVAETNALLRPMAREQGALLVDLNAAFFAEGVPLADLFSDHVHPNDRGYEIVAREFLRALSNPLTDVSSAGMAWTPAAPESAPLPLRLHFRRP